MADDDEQPPLPPPKREMNSPFLPEQWKALAGLIGNAQVPDDRLNALFECPVGLPNGESVVATQSGSVRLSNNITLQNDHTRELIGTGVRRDGLYYFDGAEGDSVQHVSVHNATSTLELWHKRMGHPSEKVVKLLPPVSNLKGDKFASRSRKCVFLGYPFGKKGWKLFDLDTKELFVSRDVKFIEDVFPFGNPGAVNIIPKNIVPTVNVEIDSDFADFVDDDADLPNPQAQTQNPTSSNLNPKPTKISCSTVGLDSLGLDNTSNGQSAPMGKGMRDKFPSVLLRDFVTHTVVAESPSPPLRLHSIPQFLAAIISSNDPKSFKEAMKDVGWQKSMHEEIRALEENGTWTLEPLPKGKRALGSQWVYRTKYFSNGDIERLKSRLVVLGNHQEAGIDYHETFSPVAKMTTVRAFLAIAASKNWELHQMDVHNAFLHGDLEEEVYMKLPPGFERSDPNLVCRLRKSLYGLKQAPRCWFAKLVTALKGYVYVDDLIISGNDSAALKTFKAYLSDCFKMKDLGVLKYFLGIKVARSSAGLFLCQRKYTLDIVSEAGLLGAKPCGFPIEHNHRLGLANGELLSNPESYRRLVGRLIYLAVTRPDLAYSVHILSQFMQEPRIEHWEAALRVVCYLKGTPGQGILLRADSDLSLQGWCDSDWAACPVTRRSLSGWLVFLGQSPISWKTKKQHTVSRSSAEAEYRAMAAVTCELKWLKGLLLSLGVHHPKAIKLFCDSQSALHMAKNPVFHERTKHIEVDCHFVRDAITDGLLDVLYIYVDEYQLGSSFDPLITLFSWVNPPIDVLMAYYRYVDIFYFPNDPPSSYNYTEQDLPINTALPMKGTKVKVLEYNETVERVFQGTNVLDDSEAHPMHLHGHSFYVIGTGIGNFDEETDPKGYNLVDPPLVNTVEVPQEGWPTIRFMANNPGVRFMHCHYDRHLSWGMDFAFIVKNGDTSGRSMRHPLAYMPPCTASAADHSLRLFDFSDEKLNTFFRT
ncbi:Retrovirus-related Pol polyprotein from transposon RE2 [Vitis vinifera]|uniref:Retrovirus-related Pol polyprotein from transposon RE2 n=1 Tax=Vitis vinifera TaxID=29760 RepID=A0A438GBG3_VITVI|nr:Retrovirus-related Pol polyprotein from transposon RE2 [Vitis vinifera]